MIDISGKPLVEWCIRNLKKNGIEDIILSIGYKSEVIENYFKDGSSLGVHISYNIEKEPLGTGGAVKDIYRKYDIKEPFILVWADNLADYNFRTMIKEHRYHNAVLTMTLTTREDVEHFGVARLDNGRIIGFVEKPKREEAPSNLINCGAFVINPESLSILPEGKSSIEHDCFEKLATPRGKVYSFTHKGHWIPTDTMEKYMKAKEEFEKYAQGYL
jgi:NDP-sugar pyrophosphorylase family protein